MEGDWADTSSVTCSCKQFLFPEIPLFPCQCDESLLILQDQVQKAPLH